LVSSPTARWQDSISGVGDDWNEHYRLGVDKLLASRGVALGDDDAGRVLYELYHEAQAAGVSLPEIPAGAGGLNCS
jgi:hypothetical protein